MTGVDVVLEALREIPDAADVAPYRAALLREMTALGRAMRQADRAAQAGEVSARGMAEVWTWVAWLQLVRGYRASTTCQVYARGMAVLLAWAEREGLDYAELNNAQFDGWQKHLALGLHHSAHWRGLQVSAARSFYAWRASRGLGRNVAADLRGPREVIRMARKYSTTDLQKLLQAAARQPTMRGRLRDVAMLLFLLSTGARREELTKVTLGALHLGRRTGLVRFHGKGSKEREVPFEGPVVDALVAWLAEREQIQGEESDAVFVSLSARCPGRALVPQSVDRMVTKHARAAGLREYGVHRFRVTFATSLYDDGAGIEEIRLLMGHEKIETTRRYLAVSERMRRTRLRADRQHQVLGTRTTAQPRWLQQAIGGMGE